MGEQTRYHHARSYAYRSRHWFICHRRRVAKVVPGEACERSTCDGRPNYGNWLGHCRRYLLVFSLSCGLWLNNVPTSRLASRFVSSVELHFVPCHFCLPHPDRPYHLCSYRWCDCLFFHPCTLLIIPAPGGKFAQKHVPLNLRQLLSAESAANDGLAYPFLSLAIYLTLEGTEGVAISHWILIGWLC